MKPDRGLGLALRYLAAVVALIFFLFPIYWLFGMSLKIMATVCRSGDGPRGPPRRCPIAPAGVRDPLTSRMRSVHSRDPAVAQTENHPDQGVIMRRPHLRPALLIAALVVGLLPAATNAATPTTTTITSVPAALKLGEPAHFVITTDPPESRADAIIELDASTNGTTWLPLAFQTPGLGEFVTVIPGDLPLGDLHLRAIATWESGAYETSTSDPVIVTIEQLQPAFTSFDVTAGNPAQPILPGSSIAFAGCIAMVSEGHSIPNRPIAFEEDRDGDWVTLATANPVTSSCGGSGKVSASFDGTADPLGEGVHHLRLSFAEEGALAAATLGKTIQVDRGASSMHLQVEELTIQLGKDMHFYGTVSAGIDPVGAMTLKDADTNQVLATQDLPGQIQSVIPALALGTHHYVATWPGDSNSLPSQSETLTVQVVATTVDATGVGVSNTTFYPYRDGYRDTVSFRGTRLEPISVLIRVYRPTGALLLTRTIARGEGAYASVWNGRYSSGSLLPSGKYKVIQTLTDFDRGACVVHQLHHDQPEEAGHQVHVCEPAREQRDGVRPRGHRPSRDLEERRVRPARRRVGWLRRGRLSVHAAVRDPLQVDRLPDLRERPARDRQRDRLQNFKICPLASGAWNVDCFDHFQSWPGDDPRYVVWRTAGGSATNNRSGRTVRGMAEMGIATAYLYKVRVKVVYQVLQ